jgi:hypothetical protein
MAGQIQKRTPEQGQLAKALEGLRCDEAIALSTIMRGGSITSAASAANVTRRTIYEWMSPTHPVGKAMAEWKKDLAETARNRLLMMSDLAATNILEALQRGDHRTALTLFTKMGILESPPVGATKTEVATAAKAAKLAEGTRQIEETNDARTFTKCWESQKGTKANDKNRKGARHGKVGSKRRGNPGGAEPERKANEAIAQTT